MPELSVNGGHRIRKTEVGDSNRCQQNLGDKSVNTIQVEGVALLDANRPQQGMVYEISHGLCNGQGSFLSVDHHSPELLDRSVKDARVKCSQQGPVHELANGFCEQGRIPENKEEDCHSVNFVRKMPQDQASHIPQEAGNAQHQASETAHGVEKAPPQVQVSGMMNEINKVPKSGTQYKQMERLSVSEALCNGNLDIQHIEGKESFRNLREDLSEPFNTNMHEHSMDIVSGSESLTKLEDVLANRTVESATDDPEQDVTMALWVKWRGKWQAGIRCSRADCPLSVLRAKPTHGRKKYFVVYFPHTRTHSWADMILVRPIYDTPEPLAYGTHYGGIELVKDLNTPRHYIVQKLAIAMLDISDRLHTEAVIESARRVTAWKEFAREASRCEGYSDLGRMLLKLHSMILVNYINPNWREKSFDSWAKRCQNARSARSVEELTEELVDSVLWDEVSDLWDAPVQPDLGSEWKTWKHEVLKWFSTSHPLEQRSFNDSGSFAPQLTRKRPKLEIRRAQVEKFQKHAQGAQIDAQLSNSQSLEKAPSLSEGPSTGVSLQSANHIYLANRGDAIALENENMCSPIKEDMGTPVGGGSTFRQCVALLEDKGRECGMWVNDGGSYCDLHMNTCTPIGEQSASPTSKDLICAGRTTHGRRCSHRSRNGAPYCKKHMYQDHQDSAIIEVPSSSSPNKLKRKFVQERELETNSTSGVVSNSCREIVLAGEDNTPIVGHKAECETDSTRGPLMGSEHGSTSSAPTKFYSPEMPRCAGWCRKNNDQCLHRAKPYSFYCEKHVPSWLRQGAKSSDPLISSDVFHDLLRNSNSGREKSHFHRASELLHEFMRGSLSKGADQSTDAKGRYMDWIISEASKDASIGECLLKLVSRERERIRALWRFDTNNEMAIVPYVSSLNSEETPSLLLPCKNDGRVEDQSATLKCKLCCLGFTDDQNLGVHWMKIHRKEAQWLFRGYACAICKSAFTNKKVLDLHIRERHCQEPLEKCILLQCIHCNSHFTNLEQMWQHVLASHSSEFSLPSNAQVQNHLSSADPKLELLTSLLGSRKLNRNPNGNHDNSRKYSCKLCGLKFDLLPDLGRHHQAAHMQPNRPCNFPPRRGHTSNASKAKPNKILKSRLKRGHRIPIGVKKTTTFGIKKHLQRLNLVSSRKGILQSPETWASEKNVEERPIESYCSSVANILFPKFQRTKLRPTNNDILGFARSACCKASLLAALECKYGVLSERLCIKAARLCSEMNVPIEWHREKFICPKGCKPIMDTYALGILMPLPLGVITESPSEPLDLWKSSGDAANGEMWEMDESHCVLDSRHFKRKFSCDNAIVVCEDLSFGKESVPVACVVDQEIIDSIYGVVNDELKAKELSPWKGFTYITERLLDPSLGLDTKSSQLGCACPQSRCHPETCDHVYLFDNDNENAEDIHGKSMHGRFPYDEKGRIILEEGYLVYECNSMCSCDRTCQNRVLQKGVRVRLEVYKTKNKGWAVRAGEAISRGMFVCEYIGEVLNDQEANRRGERYDNEGCSYLYDIDAHIGSSGFVEAVPPYVIDATNYGNVARFINHSCSPNLVNYQVLVESMDCQLAHIGLYASRDIAIGEELAYDYRYRLLPGNGCPCQCGTANCRGRLY
ncbi:histone-lysine N-methyltransferase SUVR5 isoform X1 [Amborella trichopoda]|uniref:histone-lysine N-methyltransferase SUVR5 isoform X1 n=1 Tax=Amborella trichopoda TaxID=13333 RepID=UPI0009C04CE3|nr:histone-lysine N-methyltransferase SUVR5 isoform X1 [Amborella trichopoda]XP_020530212.1 histone-lysine N-methyltransferase SUVR5 isoform X1 [Amborella trichopoda]|eukprot:XP_020530211.1 histone-lysine N-methyltransferase SUVR5 isoform X1 [Amborella trichopoda]